MISHVHGLQLEEVGFCLYAQLCHLEIYGLTLIADVCSAPQDFEIAQGCFRHLRTMFQELEECRAFELLKGQADRINYLMTKQAKVCQAALQDALPSLGL